MKDKLKVIFANRKDCFEKRGGDTVQMLKTKEYLEKTFPVEIKICLTTEEILEENESKIVHIFNIQTIDETINFIKAAKQKGKKVVLSTIYWNLLDTYYVKYLSYIGIQPIAICDFVKEILIKIFNIFIYFIPVLRKTFDSYIKKGLYGTKAYASLRRQALKEADLLLPNSYEEMSLCAKDFGFLQNYIKDKTLVVPNATDFNPNVKSNYIEKNFDLPQKYVVIAGRIDTTKNQYNLIKALFNDKQMGIVIVGRTQDEKLYNRVKKLADKRGNVYILPQIEQNRLISLYKNAVCHCLPSFYDTTGLVNLEALLCGCKIVVSNEKFCPIKFYEFDKYGELCNPYNPKSIREAIMKIVNSDKKVELTNEYIYKISYENVANLTYNAYLKVLSEKRA
ncbi:MAG: glycosyltransferase [Candidatus Gastranaerophilales bacterium]|nr:glycosyltransferase [Candidatus Gastranaerophilales bacterium]